MAITAGIQIIGQVWGTMAQIKASKVARFQARDDLRDPVNFVEYTEEQKAEAEKNVIKRRSSKDLSAIKGSGGLKDLKDLFNDYEEYKKNSAELDNALLS